MQLKLGQQTSQLLMPQQQRACPAQGVARQTRTPLWTRVSLQGCPTLSQPHLARCQRAILPGWSL